MRRACTFAGSATVLLALLSPAVTAGEARAPGIQGDPFVWTPVFTAALAPGDFTDGTIDTSFRLEVDPANANVLYMGTGVIPTPGEAPPPADGLWKSSDGGDSWININEPSTGDAGLDFFELTRDTTILDIEVCPGNSQIVAVAVNPKGFFRSEDGGTSWSWIAGGIVHTDNDPNHCAQVAHPDQTFDTVGGRWTGTTIAFDPNDCNTMYAGGADLNAIDIGAGTGDHPGMFKTTDAGATWSELNTGLGPLLDAIDCGGFGDLDSKSVAPIDVVTVPGGNVVLATTEQEIDAAIGGKSATSQLRVWSNPGSGSWTEGSSGLNASRITISGGLSDLVVASVSAGFLTLSPANNFFLLSHLGVTTVITLGGDATKGRSTGIYAGPVSLSNWVPRDNGIPVANDADNGNAQNTGPVTINPNPPPAVPGVWAVGTNLSDSAGPDSSNVWLSIDNGANWVVPPVFTGLSASPNGLFDESSVLFVEWDRDGRCMFASVLWDFRNGLTTEDDGVYRLCIN